MNCKLFITLSFGLAILLGACSSSNTSGATTGGSTNQPDAGAGGTSGSDGDQRTAVPAVNAALSTADAAVDAAVDAARTASTPTERARAATLIAQARMSLERAVEAAQNAFDTAQGSEAIGQTRRALDIATSFQRNRKTDLDNAAATFAWYGRNLVRYAFARTTIAVPRAGINTAMINRVERTIPDPTDADTQIVNPKAFCDDVSLPTCTSTTFKDIMYSDDKRVFSVADDDEGGDEFKVNGYVGWTASSSTLDETTHTGLKLTDAGLVIRTGGTAASGADRFRADFTDMRRKITTWASDSDSDGDVDAADGIRGQNGWDLTIAFDEPQARSVPVVFNDITNPVSSWTGNNAFYWKSVVRADPSQTSEDGDYYDANAFKQPKGSEDLGTYEVWLSNHIGVDTNTEPAEGQGEVTCLDGSRGTSCPFDDKNFYLNYAAYGLFVYTASTETFRGTGAAAGYNGQIGRINTLHFGYSAFGTGEGQKTTDIGEAIAGGRFHGYTLAYEVTGDRNLEAGNNRTGIEHKLLRGDVTLTVNIPKGSGAGSLEGTMNNFQQWNEENKVWTAYVDNFKVVLNPTTTDNFSESGSFSGTTTATPTTVTGTTFNLGGGTGVYKGSFYGPRADVKDLEIAGSWTVGSGDADDDEQDIYGSFGAKQRPAATPGSS